MRTTTDACALQLRLLSNILIARLFFCSVLSLRVILRSRSIRFFLFHESAVDLP